MLSSATGRHQDYIGKTTGGYQFPSLLAALAGPRRDGLTADVSKVGHFPGISRERFRGFAHLAGTGRCFARLSGGGGEPPPALLSVPLFPPCQSLPSASRFADGKVSRGFNGGCRGEKGARQGPGRLLPAASAAFLFPASAGGFFAATAAPAPRASIARQRLAAFSRLPQQRAAGEQQRAAEPAAKRRRP